MSISLLPILNQSNWCFWMNPHAIDGQLAARTVGLFVATDRVAATTSSEASGATQYLHPLLLSNLLYSYSILPAMSLDGVLALGLQLGALTRNDFIAFLEMLLDNMNPFPQPNSVIVMDNAQIHKGEAVRELVESQ